MASTRANLARLVRYPAPIAAIVAVVVMTGLHAAAAAPAPPTPTAATVTTTLDTLANQTESLTEQYDAALITVSVENAQTAAAQLDAEHARAIYQTARSGLAAQITADYETQSPFTSAAALFTSTSPQTYVDALASSDLLADKRNATLARLRAAATASEKAQQTAARRLREAHATLDAVAAQRANLDAQTATFSNILATLTISQRQTYLNRHAPTQAELATALAVPAPNAAARKVVTFALAQVGKPYVFAAAGPAAYDCSGLTMAAWASVGVSLPHFAAAQYAYGAHVSEADLKPGDLVFLYTDIHHVELYIGDGLAVSAPEEGENVQVVRLADFQNVYYGATRLTTS